MGRLQSVQVLRFVAATLVIVCHTYDPAKIGAVGVDIFFVISGYIISRVAANKAPGEFVRDRLLRIYPIYWISAIPTAALASYIGAINLPRTLTSITLWPVFGTYLQPYLVLGWTLSFEMLFYLGAALVLVERRVLVFFAIAYPFAMFGAFYTGSPLLRFIGNPIILEFLFGVAISRLPTKTPVLGAMAIGIAVLALAGSNAANLYLPLHIFELSAPERVFAWGVPAALLVWGALQFEPYLRSWKLLPWLGDASYSIYLTHGTALFIFFALPWQLKIIAAIAFGAIVYAYVEKPLMKFMRTKTRALLPRNSME